jgi:hypothetical protein
MTRFSLDYGGGAGVPAARSSGDPKTVRATASIILCVFVLQLRCWWGTCPGVGS